MQDIKEIWKQEIAAALTKLARQNGITEQIYREQVVVEIPPKPELGDLGIPMFPFAKLLRKGPPQIAQAVVAQLEADGSGSRWGSVKAEGPYVNIRLEKSAVATQVVNAILEQEEDFGRPQSLKNSKIMVEFSSPNTIKPYHFGTCVTMFSEKVFPAFLLPVVPKSGRYVSSTTGASISVSPC